MTNYADMRGRLAAAWERANDSIPSEQWPQVTRLTTGPGLDKVPPGFTAWAVGPWSAQKTSEGRQVVVLPSLALNAPKAVWERYLARVIATGSGKCPMCSQVAALDREPPAPGELGRAAFHALPLFVRVTQSMGCPAADWTERERHYFPALNPNLRTRANHEKREGAHDENN